MILGNSNPTQILYNVSLQYPHTTYSGQFHGVHHVVARCGYAVPLVVNGRSINLNTDITHSYRDEVLHL